VYVAIKKNFIGVSAEYQQEAVRDDFQLIQQDKSLEIVYQEKNSLLEEPIWVEGIECGLDNFDDFLPTGFLAILMQFALNIGYFDVFHEHVNICMKEVKFSVLNKIQTIISSIAVGCNHIKEINHKLVPYSTVANLLGMERFPDQSQINRLLRRIGLRDALDFERSFEVNIGRYILNELPEKVDIDIDTTGLVVLGDTYEFSEKGYFPNKRGKEGYQLTLCSSSVFPKFILGYILDPGNIPPGARLWDIIYQVGDVLGDLGRIGIIRADGIHGIGQDIA